MKDRRPSGRRPIKDGQDASCHRLIRRMEWRASLFRAFFRKRRDIAQPRFAGTPKIPVRRVLPFSVDIPVRSYLNYAFPLSIVSLDSRHRACLFGNLGQMFFPDDKLEYDRVLMLPSLQTADWERMGFLESWALDSHDSGFNRPELLVDLFTGEISAGSYVEIHVDEYFLPGRPAYQSIHSVHDNMLLGYDFGEGCFYIAGYGNDYGVSKVMFQDLLKAFHQMPRSQLARRSIRMIRRTESGDDGFDLENVKSQLRDYLGSRVTMTPQQMKKACLYHKARRFTGTWGLETYSSFSSYLERMSQSGKQLDLRATRTLWEHKWCMLERLKYLEFTNAFKTRRVFAQPYSTIERSARAIRFGAYEYNVKGSDKRYVEMIVRELSSMRKQEEIILNHALQSLN